MDLDANDSDISNVRTITFDVRTSDLCVTQASADSHPSGRDDGGHVQVHEPDDSLLSETERRIVRTIGGERGEALRRTLVINAKALQGERADANRTAAAMRLDVQEYLGLLEARFASEFRALGAAIGRRIERSRRESHVRQLRGV